MASQLPPYSMDDTHAYRHAGLVSLLCDLQAIGYRFITITPASHGLVNARPQNAWARDLRGIFGWSRPFREQDIDASWFERMRSAGILQPVEGGWRSSLRVSSIGNMLFAHSAFPTEEEDAVFFGPDTYRFIRELDSVMASIQTPILRCIDIGTGTGAAAIRMAQALPDADIYGTDINRYALDLARANAEAAGMAKHRKLTFKYSDLLNEVDGEFDLITANPPYLIDASERSYRHGSGLLGAQVSLDIVDAAMARLTPGGSLLLYTGVAIVDGRNPFMEALEARLDATGCSWDYTEIDPDIFGEELAMPPYTATDRIAAIRLLIRRHDKGSMTK